MPHSLYWIVLSCAIVANPLQPHLVGASLAQHQHPPATPRTPAPDQHQHPSPSNVTSPVPLGREGSGTSWLPDETPMFAIHGALGEWATMVHGIGFLQYLRDERPRGERQFGSINWLMISGRRAAAGGQLSLRGMFSLEPLTISDCGYPDLLASGEVCEGQPIVDRQHPHDLLMEISATYDRPLSSSLTLQIYGGVAGEPALGPVAFPHRPSALTNPLAPISHHWLDASHITFGVVTAAIADRRWKMEGSLFNGREPNEERYDINLAALDSYSGRVTFLPTPRVAVQFSAGHLAEAEEHDATRVDVDRVTASAIYHVPRANGGLWATTLAWGRNQEDGEATHAVLAESTLSFADRDIVFGRAEVVQKPSHDLGLEEIDERFNVVKLQIGYARFLPPFSGWRAGLGGSVSLGIVPDGLSPTYGGRVTPGIAVFAVVRPAAMH